MKACRPLLTVTLALTTIILLSGCRKSFAPISSRVTAEEMQVYETWLQHRKLNSPEDVIQVLPETAPIPLTPERDDLRMFDRVRNGLTHDGVSADAIAKLERLGDARYPLPAALDPSIATFSSRCSGSCSNTAVGTVNGLAYFSRVAFSRDGQTAFLHIHYGECRTVGKNGAAPVCGCGGGFSQYLLATKQGNDWSFKSVGPSAVD
jgi:hypothetical protein